MKLAIGTVQFGLPYGVANSIGQVTEKTAYQILEYVKGIGVNTIDTAVSYGDSEECLGNVGIEGWRVVTKLPEIPRNCSNITAWVNNQITNSLGRLGVKKVVGLMLHRPDQLLDKGGDKLWSAMQNLKDTGTVEKIGYSIYEPSQLDKLWGKYQADIIQAPYSILDQRLKTSGWLNKLNLNNTEVHIRSIFLQGLLLMDSKSRPIKFNRWEPVWKLWDEWLTVQGLTPLEACLGFVEREPEIDKIVVGVDSMQQAKQIVYSLGKAVGEIPDQLCITDQNLINPSNWNSL